MVRSSGGRSFQRRGAVMDMRTVFIVCVIQAYDF